MKPKILDPWTLSRVQMPERGFEKQFVSKCLHYSLMSLRQETQPPFNYVRTRAEEFRKLSVKEGMGQHMKDYLAGQQKDFTRWVECPSHFWKEPSEPVGLQR